MPTIIRDVQANDMTFRCRFAGETGETGEPVMLLHGFPETSHMWVDLLPKLEAAGYRCMAPDQRGYSPGARPEGKENYTYRGLAGDVFALADAWGVERFHLVGHDWGAGAGWAAVALEPERIASWSALSVPHVAAFGTAIREDADQAQRSQYITFFQEPGVAEGGAIGERLRRVEKRLERQFGGGEGGVPFGVQPAGGAHGGAELVPGIRRH
ncbi:MAG: alpha/beta fold hydrolase [Dehalococcoidia bacterium]|nr:alpha/beta fold hydrolase [Dehalococcoidia bacterium]